MTSVTAKLAFIPQVSFKHLQLEFVTMIVMLTSFFSQKSGRIVNVIAVIARGFPGMVHTGAARAGVDV
jgi:hypothetical protein